MSTHDERVEGIIRLLTNEDGGINHKDALMALGEAAGLVAAFMPPEQRPVAARIMTLHVTGVAAMAK